MFRRRPPRRPLRPLHPGRRPGRKVPQELIQANQMLESGNYKGAAEHFEQIARIAETRDGRHVPHFYLQAGRACILAGQIETGLAYLKHGLSLFAGRGEWIHLRRAGRRVVKELEEQGLSDAAHEIASWLDGAIPAGQQNDTEDVPVRKPILPTHCPSCGGAVRLNEVDWLDEITAECAYCGSPIREEK